MSDHRAILQWIDSQRQRMRELVAGWASINSGSYNLEGLAKLRGHLTGAFRSLGGDITEVDLPPQQTVDSRGKVVFAPLGKALAIRKRPHAPLQVFLGIHMDTVYAADDPFQAVEQIDANTLGGPGVIDAKGGLAVMLLALEALERSEQSSEIGWEVLINPDEEIGSPGSSPLFVAAARRNHLGLVFEPTFPDGAMVSERKGSGNFSIIVRGRAAHAGRDFAAGRSAIVAAADLVVEAHALNGRFADVTINTGRIDGGGPSNVVPDLAIVRLNARIARPEDQHRVEEELKRIADDVSSRRDVRIELHGGFSSPPKVLDEASRRLRDHITEAGSELGLSLAWRPSGGASDGNRLAAAGLPVIDTMGPVGGNLHSPREYLLLDSLTERARLSALMLLRLASSQIAWPTERNPS